MLKITDAPGVVYSLRYTLASPLLASLDGASGVVNVTVSNCTALEVFDASSLACICAAGAFLPSGGGECTACPPGSFAPRAGTPMCSACPANTFASGGGTSCTPCPATSTSSASSASLRDCECEFGTYAVYSDDESTFSCAPCPDGALCTGHGGEPLALEGYWHEPNVTDAFYQCLPELCLEETQEMVAAGADNCREGHTGVLCGVCLDGFVYQGETCEPCRPGMSVDTWAAGKRGGLAFGCIVLFVITSGAFLLSPLFPEAQERASKRAIHLLNRVLRHGKRDSNAQAEASLESGLAKQIRGFVRFCQFPLYIMIETIQIVSSCVTRARLRLHTCRRMPSCDFLPTSRMACRLCVAAFRKRYASRGPEFSGASSRA